VNGELQQRAPDLRLARPAPEPDVSMVPRGDRLRRAAPPPSTTTIAMDAMAPSVSDTRPAAPAADSTAIASRPVAIATAQLPVRRGEVARGLRYLHERANANTSELLWVTSSLQAALEALQASGHLDAGALEARRKQIAERLAAVYSERGMGVSVDSVERDKYTVESTVEIDCGSRLHLCKAACCKLHFALSRQDVAEGIVRWDFGQPYRIARGADGYCVHLDRTSKSCGIHANRPTTCRGYDCREDQRIWVDFDKRIPNPHLDSLDWPRGNAAGEEAAPRTAPETRDAAGFAAPPAAAAIAAPSRGARLMHRALVRLVDRPLLWEGRGWFVSTYGLWLGIALGAAVFTGLWLVTQRFHYPLPHLAILLGFVAAAYGGGRGAALLERLLAQRLGQPLIARRGHLFYGGLAAGGLYIFLLLPLGGGGPPLLLIDCAAPAAALGYALGKLGCLANGCCIGQRSTGPWSILYRHEATKAVGYYDLAGVPLLPVQLVEAGLGAALFAVLLLLPDAFYGSGKAAGTALLGLALGRALLQPLRYRAPEERAYPILATVGNLLFVVVGAALLAGIAGGLGPAPAAAEPGASLAMVALAGLLSGAAAFAAYGVRRVAQPAPQL
jgi:prolipoprotein diacylglyceryltransferase/Fe-S-cluster containining protein